jgi:hypothetical protein
MQNDGKGRRIIRRRPYCQFVVKDKRLGCVCLFQKAQISLARH